MIRGAFSWPVTSYWLFVRLRAAGYRPQQYPTRKTKDHRARAVRYTIRLPNKCAGVTSAAIVTAINDCHLFCKVKCKVRKNRKWVGVTLTLILNEAT